MLNRKVLVTLFLFGITLLSPSRVLAETATFQQGVSGYTGNSTSYLDRWNPDTNMGASGNAWFRPDNQSPILRFDLSSLTTNALVQNAKLKIYVISNTNANPITTKVYKLLRDWNENETTWHKVNNSTEWSWVGANGIFSDRVDSPSSILQITTVNTYYEYDITSLVRGWVRYPQTNKGIIIVPESFSNVGYSIGSDNNYNLARRPILTVDYAVSSLNDFYPSIQITNPVNEVFLTGNQNITVNASDDRGIQQVNYFLDSTAIGSSATAPYMFNFNTGNYSVGRHILKAVVMDTAGQTSESAVIIYLYRLDNGILTIGQITDTHVGTSASYEPADKTLFTQRFQQGISDLNNVVKPAVIIHTGDIVTILDPASGSLAKSIIDQSSIPVKTIAGNHDNFLENYLYYFGPFNTWFDIGQNRFVGFSTGMLNESWIRGLLSSTSNKGIVFSHYVLRLPQGSLADPGFYQMSAADDTILQNILRDYQVPAYLSGHLHQPFLLEDYVSHAVEIGGPALSDKGTYNIITIDNGIVSSNEIALGDWPAIVITSPQRYYPDGGSKEISGSQKIRVKIFDNVNIPSVLYKIDDQGWQRMNRLSNSVWEATADFGTINPGVHAIIVQALDSFGRSHNAVIQVKSRQSQTTPTPTPTPTLLPTPTPTPTIPVVNPSSVIAVNAGGQNYTDQAGNLWQADYGFSSGQTYSTQTTITGTSDPTLYQTERFSLSGYFFPISNGTYTVVLKFAEIYSGCQFTGCRIFNVQIEGNQVLTNFDVFAQAGGYTALDKTFVVNVNDGILNINFSAVRNAAQINAIKIISGGSITVTPTPTPTPSPTPTISPSPTPTLIPTPTPSPSPLAALRINSGGSALTDLNNNFWQGDYGYSGGQTFSTTTNITGTTNPKLYQTERYNMTGYQFTVPNGSRTITLKFAEIYYGCLYRGCRVFNVSLEGNQVLAGFDIFVQANGGYKAIDKTFTVNVTDGVLNIDFGKIDNAPQINGIEIN